MNPEGRALIEIRSGDVPAVLVSFQQPGNIGRLLFGKTPEQALEIIPALFSLCGMAQAHAAHCALAAAMGVQPGPETLAARQCLTEMECLRENALRIALDWPRFVGETVEPVVLKPLMRLVLDLKQALFGDARGQGVEVEACLATSAALALVAGAETMLQDLVFGEPLATWRERPDAAAVKAWARRSQTTAARLLERVSAQGWETAGATRVEALGALEADAARTWISHAAADAPTLPDTPSDLVPETTLLARHAGDRRLAPGHGGALAEAGLWHRLAARLIELSELPDRMRALVTGDLAPSRGRVLVNGIALAEISAARGKLLHAVALEENRISAYRILPPTRWNFAADGIAARALGRIAEVHAADAPLLAELTVNAIDPCVGHSVRIH